MVAGRYGTNGVAVESPVVLVPDIGEGNVWHPNLDMVELIAQEIAPT